MLNVLLYRSRLVPRFVSIWGFVGVLSLAAGLAIGTLAGVVMFGVTAYVPPLIQGVMGGSPLDAGVAVGAMSIGWPVGSIVSGRTMLRFGARPLVLTGAGMLVVGTLMLTRAGQVADKP